MKQLIFSIALLCLAAGCAKYEYQLTQPPDLQRHIGTQTEEVAVEPLVYTLQTYQNRLIMHVHNPTDEPITLQGSRSTVVAPDGQSRPLEERTIAPGSYVKLIFPPLRPRIERRGPSIGIGVGTTISTGDGRTRHIDYPDAEPRYLTVYDNSALCWDWDGETDITLSLSYLRGDRSFIHSFAFHRTKMN